MLKILALQKLTFSGLSEVAAESSESVTCTGCSCASNVCKSEAAGTTFK